MEIENALREGEIFIDVRTKKEFEEATIPCAINIPLFDEAERAIVGILYKEDGKEVAVRKGIELVSEKLNKIVDSVEKLDGKIIVFCWRGGMRSESFVNLLRSLGKDAHQLDGGYKKYREHIRKRLEGYDLKLITVVLNGLTGVGKTEILREFSNSLDLEGLAQHRSSLLGAIGLEPRSQKMFESLLLERLDKLQREKWILVEGESRKVGDLIIPDFLFKAMKNGIQILVIDDLGERTERLLGEYVPHIKNYKIKKIVDRLKLSKKIREEMKDLIDKEQYGQFTKLILKEYYDPLYSHSIKKIKYDFKIKFKEWDGIKEKVDNLLDKRSRYNSEKS